MEQFSFDSTFCDCQITSDRCKQITSLHIRMKASIDDRKLTFKAANPADRRASYSGSGLPFSSPEMAMQNTPNMGVLELDSQNTCNLSISTPNSYYAALGTVLIPPTVYLFFKINNVEYTLPVKVDDPIPLRTLTYDVRRVQSMFYDNIHRLPVRSQEQVLRDSEYSMIHYDNFWGAKPSL